jgi:hypothetical protein
MADDSKPIGSDKPRSNIYTIMLLITAAAYILAIVLAIVEMNDTAHFRYQLMGEQEYPAGSSTNK